jgi:hypothetical protein
MIALTQAQGVVLVIGGAIFVLIAGAVLVVRGRRRVEAPDIPIAMRPGPSDPDLETPLLTKLQGWGVLLVVFFVIWIPVTWLFEPGRNLDQEKALLTDSIARGASDVQLFNEENQGGIGCVRCHGPNLSGSKILDTATGAVVNTPNLTTVCGGPWTGHTLIYSLNDIYITIMQGRNLMPSWSIKFQGALDDQQINDIVNYITSIQNKSAVPYAHNICINPDATAAAVKQFGPPPGPPTSNGQP